MEIKETVDINKKILIKLYIDFSLENSFIFNSCINNIENCTNLSYDQDVNLKKYITLFTQYSDYLSQYERIIVYYENLVYMEMINANKLSNKSIYILYDNNILNNDNNFHMQMNNLVNKKVIGIGNTTNTILNIFTVINCIKFSLLYGKTFYANSKYFNSLGGKIINGMISLFAGSIIAGSYLPFSYIIFNLSLLITNYKLKKLNNLSSRINYSI